MLSTIAKHDPADDRDEQVEEDVTAALVDVEVACLGLDLERAAPLGVRACGRVQKQRSLKRDVRVGPAVDVHLGLAACPQMIAVDIVLVRVLRNDRELLEGRVPLVGLDLVPTVVDAQETPR